MKRIRVVGGALLHDGRCLVAQRSQSMSAALKWEFPGGKLEQNETAAQALARELREELGIEVRVDGWLGSGRSQEDGRIIELDVYLATLLTGEPHAHEHAALRWADAQELPGLDWAAADIPIVPSLLAHLARQALAAAPKCGDKP